MATPREADRAPKQGKKRKVLIVVGALLVLALVVGLFAWYKFFRDVPQPSWITEDPEKNFLYGSIGGEAEAGIPYWILVTLPRIFPEYLPGPGGYASLGLPWEEGQELPIGFSKKTIGFERVGFNCALCHATRYRTRVEETPTYVAAGGSHTADIEGLLDFFKNCAKDPRFESETILSEIDLAYPLSFVDRQLYKYLLIPLTRDRLAEQGRDFAWAGTRPAWGPGRDAPMNLTKFNFLRMPEDDSIDNTDFPSIWDLEVRQRRPEQKMNLDGATPVVRSVLIDSALGLGATNTPFFHRRMADIETWLRALPPPSWPESLPLDRDLAARGEGLFRAHCADCHATDQPGNRMGTVIPIAEIGTDRERMDTWTLEAAEAANAKVASLGITRDGMEKHEGYVALPLTGVWLKGPYLHNGSVPTLRDLLSPPEERPTAFYRGYDLLDSAGVGFVSRRCPVVGERGATGGDGPCRSTVAAPGEACVPAFVRADGALVVPDGWCLDTAGRGNGNGGHLYGTALSPDDQDALVEYLKTL